MDPSYLRELFPQIKTIFKPQVVKYSNTNPDIRASDGTHGERIDWKVSSYMEVDTTTGGAMQKGVQPDPALLALCAPLLERCASSCASWLKGMGCSAEGAAPQRYCSGRRVGAAAGTVPSVQT